MRALCGIRRVAWRSQPGRRATSELGNDVLEDIAEIIELLAAGRRRLRYEVEDFSVLEAIIGQPRDPAILVEINRDDPLVPHLVGHERHRAPRGLRNIIKPVSYTHLRAHETRHDL